MINQISFQKLLNVALIKNTKTRMSLPIWPGLVGEWVDVMGDGCY